MRAPAAADPSFLAALVAIKRQPHSVRAHLPERIPDSVLDDCFDLAILAPTSQNLECWLLILLTLLALPASGLTAGGCAVGSLPAFAEAKP